ncbi:hypothetical protein F2309_21450, partial [Salmonella enterica]|nr:hypothetical protein [Salmonella enterica]
RCRLPLSCPAECSTPSLPRRTREFLCAGSPEYRSDHQGVSLDIENYCTLRLFSVHLGCDKRDRPR